ncbi:hypothetical protein HMPREF0663_11116 [Hoylesella oralis ATCC 33269]|uniref:Uncharacterized protein n=1 Tax=Hoylesella oralis ATCC 33269 TaxID=873533 RepID=E7RPL5_9BACT|nr:hypothetical protein HMPREF0663_11116 [Hoylesella oralis ATCC 33269]
MYTDYFLVAFMPYFITYKKQKSGSKSIGIATEYNLSIPFL